MAAVFQAMNGVGRVVGMMTVALIVFTGANIVALVFVEGYLEAAPLVIPATLGPLTTAIGIIGGAWAARGAEAAKKEEQQQIQSQSQQHEQRSQSSGGGR